MKSTQATTYRTLNSELNRLNGSLDTLRSQAATGKKLLRPSDDPAAIRPVLSARTDIRATDRFVDSLSVSLDRLENQDTYLDQAENLLVSAKETAINAINGSMSDADRTTLADQIGYIKSEMLSVANAQVGGQYIFSGFAEDTVPFVENGDTVSFQGDSNKKKLETSPGEFVQTNLSGAQLFMGMTDTDGDGVLEQTGENVFEVLTNLERAIRGESGQVYNGNSVLPTSDIGYLDAAAGDYTPVALDAAAAPLLDTAGAEVPLTFNGDPIALQPVLGINGQPLTISQYNTQFPSGVTDDYNGNPLSPTALDQPMYLYNDGATPVDFNASGDPVMPYSGPVVTGLSTGSYVTVALPATVSGGMTGPTSGLGDLTIGGQNVAASASADQLATNIMSAATTAGLTVTAAAADSTTGTDLNSWSDVVAPTSFSLVVEGVPLFNNDIDGVNVSDIDAAMTANAAALTAAGVTVTGTAGVDLQLTKADGTNLDIEQTLSAGGVGFTAIADDGSTETYYGAVTITSAADFTIAGADLAASGFSAATNSVPAPVATATGMVMTGSTVGGGDLTIGGQNVAASTSADQLAASIMTAATTVGLTVTAAAADSTTGTDLNSWSDVVAPTSFSLVVEGVPLFNNDVDGVSAADIDSAMAANAVALTAAGVAVSGTAGVDLELTKADGTNLDIEQTLSAGAAAGFTSIANDGTTE
ncbi:MAG: flagellar hook-associated protein FlgL, partial [Deltaproteobacteria bacterium]|nr:flagellar hook-associated protein FlgL [Deltaproteobacteria bacterium]